MLYNLAIDGVFGKISDSEEEQILKGEMSPWEGYKVIDGKIVNIAEMEQQAEIELHRRLNEHLTPEAEAMAKIDKKYAEQQKIKLTELLAVRQQAGWPIDIIWP